MTLYMTCITEITKLWLDMDSGEYFNETTEPLYAGNIYDQYFVAQRSIIESAKFRVVTWEREYSSTDVLSVSIIHRDTGEVAAHCSIFLRDLEDNRMTEIPLEGTHLKKGEWYCLRFEGNTTDEAHSISIMLSDRGEDGWVYSEFNGEQMDHDLSVSIEGRGMF